MARVEKKNKKIGENLILGIAIGAAAAAVLIFLIWLLVTLFTPEVEEEKDIYENYYHLTSAEFESILKVNTSVKDDNGQLFQYDSLLNTDSTNTDPDKNKLYDMVMDSDIIYILSMSSINNYGRDSEVNDNIALAIKNAVINKINYQVFEKSIAEENYRICFLLFDYRGGNFEILQPYWNLLFPTQESSTPITTHSTFWNVDYIGVSNVITPWLIEIKSSEASTTDLPEIHVWAGVKGSIKDYFYLELLPKLESIDKEEEN
ncbi:MAG: hypothetical protein LBV55_04135 [Acholeplasmatales bacterium]|jgi:hypothetical protein|nr:hypothetical protein [Acholeplasmatales bacterium]